MTEAYPESEFNVRGASAEGAGDVALSIGEMLESLGGGAAAAGLKKRLSKLEKDKVRTRGQLRTAETCASTGVMSPLVYSPLLFSVLSSGGAKPSLSRVM